MSQLVSKNLTSRGFVRSEHLHWSSILLSLSPSFTRGVRPTLSRRWRTRQGSLDLGVGKVGVGDTGTAGWGWWPEACERRRQMSGECLTIFENGGARSVVTGSTVTCKRLWCGHQRRDWDDDLVDGGAEAMWGRRAAALGEWCSVRGLLLCENCREVVRRACGTASLGFLLRDAPSGVEVRWFFGLDLIYYWAIMFYLRYLGRSGSATTCLNFPKKIRVLKTDTRSGTRVGRVWEVWTQVLVFRIWALGSWFYAQPDLDNREKFRYKLPCILSYRKLTNFWLCIWIDFCEKFVFFV
jgi:hypothetical protein